MQDNIYNELLLGIHKFSRDNLDSSVRHYLLRRGLANTIIDKFEIGYFPIGMSKLFSIVDPEKLRQHGLVHNANFSGFQNRVIFPIKDQYDNLVALIGRTFDKREENLREYISSVSGRSSELISERVKYWHNVYDKSSVMYGLNYAKFSIRKTKCVFVGEGPFDLILAHQCKIINTVATAGTALTIEQLSLLSRYAKEIVLTFDPDMAGIESMDRIKEKISNRFDVKLSQLLLPCGYDLHDFLLRQGRQVFDDILNYRYVLD